MTEEQSGSIDEEVEQIEVDSIEAALKAGFIEVDSVAFDEFSRQSIRALQHKLNAIYESYAIKKEREQHYVARYFYHPQANQMFYVTQGRKKIGF